MTVDQSPGVVLSPPGRRGSGEPVSPPPAAAARPRLRELDLLRFVAAFVVLLHHFAGLKRPMWNGDPREIFPELKIVSHFGYLGVDLFFVISGFVILMSAWNRGPADFTRSRVVRLFPAYWFAVALAVVVYLGTNHSYGLDSASEVGTLERFLPNMTMLQAGVGAPHMEVSYWTLWVELHFYALIALFAWYGIGYARCVWFMGGWLLLSVFAREANEPFLKALLIADWAPYFIAGMALYLVYKYGPNLVLWLLVAFCWALACYSRVKFIHPVDKWPGVHEWLVPLTITAIFAVMALVALGRLGFLRWRGLTVLGAMTYPVYLMHETISRPIISELRALLNPWAVLGIAVAVTLVMSYLVYRLIEQPGARALSAGLKKAVAQIRAADTTAR